MSAWGNLPMTLRVLPHSAEAPNSLFSPEQRRTSMLTTMESENSDRIVSTRIDKELIALAWVIAAYTVVFLMMPH